MLSLMDESSKAHIYLLTEIRFRNPAGFRRENKGEMSFIRVIE